MTTSKQNEISNSDCNKDDNDIKIINLSKRELNQTEINLLEKGLNFTPTPVKTDSQQNKGRFSRIYPYSSTC